MDIYREQILDHYRHPRNWGKLETPTYSAEVYNEFCGDKINIYIKVNGEKNFDQEIIKETTFEAEGCAISGASASMLTELVKGKSLRELQKLKSNDIVEMLGVTLSPIRLKCALLPLEAMQKAIKL